MHSRAELSGRPLAGLRVRRALLLAGFCCALLLVGCRPAARPATQPITPAAEAAAAAPLTSLAPLPSATPSVTPSPTPTLTPTPHSSIGLLKKTDNILVMGIDQRPNDVAWNTDTIMVLAVNPPKKSVGEDNMTRHMSVD